MARNADTDFRVTNNGAGVSSTYIGLSGEAEGIFMQVNTSGLGSTNEANRTMSFNFVTVSPADGEQWFESDAEFFTWLDILTLRIPTSTMMG